MCGHELSYVAESKEIKLDSLPVVAGVCDQCRDLD